MSLSSIQKPANKSVRKKIGLLGGSFNPAHRGHRRLSLYVLRRLNLDAVWWLVSPQNPLKKSDDMAPLSARLRQAKKAAAHKKIHVKNLESQLKTRYTIDTVTQLQKKFPDLDFVWIMGSDNLSQFDRWRKWRQIGRKIAICVVARKPGIRAALQSVAAKTWRQNRVPQTRAADILRRKKPAWVFLSDFYDANSATAIRAKKSRKWWI